MNHREIEEEAAPKNKADWAKIAAWTFGSWAVLVPLAAGIVIAGQNQQIANQEKILTQLNQLRYDFMEKNSEQDRTLATLAANQVVVLQWKARMEAEELDH